MRSRSPGPSLSAVVVGLVVSTLVACSGSANTSTEPSRAISDTSTTAPIASSTSKVASTCTGHSLPRDPSVGEQSIRFGGVERTFRVALPADYAAGAAVPLILQFHGFISNGARIDIDTGLSQRGTAQGFAVVTPDSLGEPTQWNAFAAPDQADDFGFVAALIGHIEGQVCIDRGRVAAAGHSNGAAFVGFLPCKVPHTFAAIAMASATIPPICPDSEQPSVYATAGSADPQVPADGGQVGGGPVAIPPAEQSIAAYRKAYGCDPEPKRTEPELGVTRERATGCRGDRLVVYDRIEGGTHPWPGGQAAKADPSESEAGRHYDDTGAVLTFLMDAPPLER